MKRIIAMLLCVVLLCGAFAVTAFAKEEGEVKFSVKGAEGRPGDLVEVEVYLDENPGFWACEFYTMFDDRYFTLISVDNGEVFTDGEFMKSILTNKGMYEYYAENTSNEDNKYATGLILTLTFEISKAAPNGAHNIKLEFPKDYNGYFFDATTFDPDSMKFVKYAKPVCTKTGDIIVTGSDATESPDTNKEGDIVEPSETKPAPGIPVTEAVKNEAGETVINDDGSVMTKEVKDEDGNVIYYETDKKGEIVTDDKGAEVTFVETTQAPSNTSPDGSGQQGGGLDKFKIILICAVAAVVIGAVVVIIVLTRPKNAKKAEKTEDTKENKDNDGSDKE